MRLPRTGAFWVLMVISVFGNVIAPQEKKRSVAATVAAACTQQMVVVIYGSTVT